MLKTAIAYLGDRGLLPEISGNAATPGAADAGEWETFAECLRSRRGISFWWRDDDVGGDGRNILRRKMHERRLENMLALLDRYGIPAVFAVAPYKLRRYSAGQIALLKKYGAYAAMHGICHRNNAGPGRNASEFPSGCDVEAALSAILKHKRELEEIFGNMLLPVFVPPWNTMCEELEARLRASGFTAISKYNRPSGKHDDDNVDVDFIDWRKRDLRDERAVLADIVTLLRNEDIRVIGLMNHHKVVSRRGLVFFDKLFSTLTRHSDNVAWIIPHRPRT
ncbi:MAG: hypothetical protein LBC14_00055 [Desulfovibrio sp.]|nr:hypothetical protein [Desulfovibrio sp.]